MQRKPLPRGFRVLSLIAFLGWLATGPALWAADDDFAGPLITITSHTNGQVVHTKTIVLSGTATDAGYGGHGVYAVYARGLVNNATAAGNDLVNWSQTITLTPGANYPLVYAYDNSANRNSREIPFTINFQPLDADPPALAITSHENGQVVDTPVITVAGTASDGGHGDNGISSVYLNGTLDGVQGTGAAQVAWSREIKLHPGSNHVNVYAYDASDVQNERIRSTVIVFQPRDALPPSIQVTSHTAGQTVTSSTVTIAGTASDAGRGDNGISSVYLQGTLPGVSAEGAQPAPWSRTVELRPGANQIGIYAYDASDVQNMAYEFLTIHFQPADTLPPLLAVTSHTDGETVHTSRITLEGTATDAGRGGQGIASVYVGGLVPGARATGDGLVQWRKELDLVPGRNVFFVYAEDGNAFPNQSSYLAFTLNYQAADTLGPSLTVASHADGATVNSSSIVLAGTASDAGRGDNGVSTVYLRGKIAGTESAGRDTVNWTRQVTLVPGRNLIDVSAWDAAEFPNQTTVTLVLNYVPADQDAPLLEVTSHQEGQIVTTPLVTLQGTATDAGRGNNGISGVWINFKRLADDTATGAGIVHWSRTLPLNPGKNTLYISASDASETPQEARISLTLIYQAEDEAGPAILVEAPESTRRTVTSPTLTVSGTATDAGRGDNGVGGVQVNGQNAAGGVATGAGVAAWSQVITLVPGANVISIVAVDQSPRRNSAAHTLTVIYDPEDSTGPLLTLNAPSSGQRVHSARLTVSGVASDAGQGDHGIDSVTVNGVRATNDSATGQGTASFSRTIDLIPGLNVIAVVARDASPRKNATAASVSVTFEPVDLTGPEVTVVSHRSGQVVTSADVRIEGTASDRGLGDSGIQDVTVSGAFTALTGPAEGHLFTWSHTLTLQAGTNIISIAARDGSAAHNASVRTLTLVYEPVDRTPPQLEITSHRNGQTVASPSVLLAGSATDDGLGDSGIASVTVNQTPAPGGTAAGEATAQWSHSLRLSPGSNVISVVAKDGQGNSATRTLTLVYDPAGVPAPEDFRWARNGGGASSDAAHAVATDRRGNSYVTGFFEGSATFGSVTLLSAGESDIFLAKYDPEGLLLWARRAGGSGVDAALAVTLDLAGHCYVTGYFSGMASFAETQLVSNGAFDLFVACYDPEGILSWAVPSGSQGGVYGAGIGVDAEGHPFVTGSFYQEATFGEDVLVTNHDYDAFVAKLDPDGTFLWGCGFGGLGTDQGHGLAMTREGHCMVVGSFEGEASFADDPIARTSSGARDLFVGRLDSEGDLVWLETAGGEGVTLPGGIAVDPQGHCLITGYYDEVATFGHETFTNAGYYDLFVAKYHGADGSLIWARNTGTPFGINGIAIRTDARGQVYLAGSFIGPVALGPHALENGSLTDVFIAKLDAAGGVLWAKQAGGDEACVAFGLSVSPAGACHVVGSMTGQAHFGTHTLFSSTVSDGFVAKLPPDSSVPEPQLTIEARPSGDLSPAEAILESRRASYRITVRADREASQDLVVRLHAEGAAPGEDYLTTLAGSSPLDEVDLILRAGTQETTFSLEILEDDLEEGLEILILRLLSPPASEEGEGYVLASPSLPVEIPVADTPRAVWSFAHFGSLQPTLEDSDDDGLTDFWEYLLGEEPLVPAGAAKTDPLEVLRADLDATSFSFEPPAALPSDGALYVETTETLEPEEWHAALSCSGNAPWVSSGRHAVVFSQTEGGGQRITVFFEGAHRGFVRFRGGTASVARQ